MPQPSSSTSSWAVGVLFALGLFILMAGMLTTGPPHRRGPRRFLVSRLVRLGVPVLLYALVDAISVGVSLLLLDWTRRHVVTHGQFERCLEELAWFLLVGRVILTEVVDDGHRTGSSRALQLLDDRVEGLATNDAVAVATVGRVINPLRNHVAQWHEVSHYQYLVRGWTTRSWRSAHG